MGENLDMPDREAVRTPMPWSDRPGGGFSTADEAKLPRKPIRDGSFGYRKLNVEAQRHDPGSLLNWMERTIRTRKEWPAIGWGEWRVLGTRNPRVLALLATWHDTAVLAIHNFSDAPERATIRLPGHPHAGAWRHLHGVGETKPPAVQDGTLSAQLPAYGYHWFGAREAV